MAAPEYWREAIGSHPKYFIHFREDNQNYFGLSKFCAFSDISLEDYVLDQRRQTSGGTTQKLISKLCNQQWTPLSNCDPVLARDFKSWFTRASHGNIKLQHIHLISLGKLKSDTEKPCEDEPSIYIDPDTLAKRIKTQEEIGKAGEEIAIKHEIARLNKKGVIDAEKYIEHISLKNAAAGFDIKTIYAKERRYIEVKSSTKLQGKFYISPNEIKTLRRHGENAYLYFVHVSDTKNKIGRVMKEIRNPFGETSSPIPLSPALYLGKITLPNQQAEADEESWEEENV